MTTLPPIGPPGLPASSVSSNAPVRKSEAASAPARTPREIQDGEREAQEARAAEVTRAKQDAQAERSEVERAMQEIKKAVDPVARNLLFSIDEDTGRTLVKIVDASTKEVIRQIPSEELLAIAKALDKQAGEITSGVFVQQKA